MLDLEGGFDLDGDLGVLRDLYRLGLRSAQLSAHNWANNFADSCCSPPKYHGLNDRGRAVVREMNRLGMVINVSHASDETIAQALELSTAPVVATHHGLRSVNNIPRNMPEDLMQKIAAKGGVIGFQIGNEFHNVKAFDWRTQHAGKPFWDTSEIASRKGQLTIEEIDRKVAPQFPMVGLNMPDDVLFSPDDWIAVVEKAIADRRRGPRVAGQRLRRRSDAAARHARHLRPADAHRGHAAPRLERGAHPEIPGVEFAAGVPPHYGTA